MRYFLDIVGQDTVEYFDFLQQDDRYSFQRLLIRLVFLVGRRQRCHNRKRPVRHRAGCSTVWKAIELASGQKVLL